MFFLLAVVYKISRFFLLTNYVGERTKFAEYQPL